ncbi:expressed unknown protein [Seminavis robusta]|uniref:Uncharacterized protein n=1 Tax=Seminavis robusta TaxID=568900 RepID=A0A9N8DEW0_9STRA|nr:expressed unknown protein [Seminavis robusta]|eukprot:Sro56_g032920.1 n/a (717) ;mRNA; r:106693-108843
MTAGSVKINKFIPTSLKEEITKSFLGHFLSTPKVRPKNDKNEQNAPEVLDGNSESEHRFEEDAIKVTAAVEQRRVRRHSGQFGPGVVRRAHRKVRTKSDATSSDRFDDEDDLSTSDFDTTSGAEEDPNMEDSQLPDDFSGSYMPRGTNGSSGDHKTKSSRMSCSERLSSSQPRASDTLCASSNHTERSQQLSTRSRRKGNARLRSLSECRGSSRRSSAGEISQGSARGLSSSLHSSLHGSSRGRRRAGSAHGHDNDLSAIQSPRRASDKSPRRSSDVAKSPKRRSDKSPRRASDKSPRRSSDIVKSPRRRSDKSPRRASDKSPRKASYKSPKTPNAVQKGPRKASDKTPCRTSDKRKSPHRISDKSPRRSTLRSSENSAMSTQQVAIISPRSSGRSSVPRTPKTPRTPQKLKTPKTKTPQRRTPQRAPDPKTPDKTRNKEQQSAQRLGKAGSSRYDASTDGENLQDFYAAMMSPMPIRHSGKAESVDASAVDIDISASNHSIETPHEEPNHRPAANHKTRGSALDDASTDSGVLHEFCGAMMSPIYSSKAADIDISDTDHNEDSDNESSKGERRLPKTPNGSKAGRPSRDQLREGLDRVADAVSSNSDFMIPPLVQSTPDFDNENFSAVTVSLDALDLQDGSVELGRRGKGKRSAVGYSSRHGSKDNALTQTNVSTLEDEIDEENSLAPEHIMTKQCPSHMSFEGSQSKLFDSMVW